MIYLRWRIRIAYNHVHDKILLFIAWHLPKSVVYWCSIRLMANATQGPWSGQIVPDLYAMDALDRW